jgi:predicted nuclease of predicted toxin-antitoxin system
MRILIDMNLSPLWVQFLVAHGIEAVHWSSVGKASAPDSEILDYAASSGFALFTHDLDFGVLLAAGKSRHPSVIQVRTQDVLPSAVGAVVVRAIQACRDQLEAGAIVTVDITQNRIRLLPLRE